MTTNALEYKWITEVQFCFLNIFGFLQSRMEGRVLLQIRLFYFSMAQYLHTCSLARWLSHMGAPLLDYFPPSDGNLSPLKDFLPLFLVRSVLPSILHGRFRLKRFISAPHFGSVQIVATTLSCTHTGSQKNVELWFHMNCVELPQFLALNTEFKFVFRAKIVFNKDMS